MNVRASHIIDGCGIVFRKTNCSSPLIGDTNRCPGRGCPALRNRRPWDFHRSVQAPAALTVTNLFRFHITKSLIILLIIHLLQHSTLLIASQAGHHIALGIMTLNLIFLVSFCLYFILFTQL